MDRVRTTELLQFLAQALANPSLIEALNPNPVINLGLRLLT